MKTLPVNRNAMTCGRAPSLHRACLFGICLLGLAAMTAAGGAWAGQARGGVAATAHPLATDAALEMFAQGGNAVDAAVAAAFAIGVVEPDGSGLGGGGGMLVYLHDSGQTLYLNYYHQAPAHPISLNITADDDPDRSSAASVLVPGTAAGLCRALEDYGTLPRSVVLAPAIRYARDGFAMDATLAGLVLDGMERLQADPELAELFFFEGFPRMEGELIVQPQLAEVLQAIADQGRDGFYRGEVAEALVAGVTERGGSMTLEDLADFEPMISEPVRGSYRDLDVVSAAPPHSGVTLIEMLNMIEHLEFDPAVHFSQSADQIHMLAEIFRRASADRTQYLGDPRFVRTPILAMADKGYARERVSRINPYRAEPLNYRDTVSGPVRKFDDFALTVADWASRPIRREGWTDEDDDDLGLERPFHDAFDRWGAMRRTGTGTAGPQEPAAAGIREPDWPVRWNSEDEEALRGLHDRTPDPFNRWDHGADEDSEFEGAHTTHLSVIDADSNMVALTQTLGNFFGSTVMVHGVLLNNGGVNFSNLSEANLIAPNRRPRSSLTPTLLFRDGVPFMSLGSPGAGRIMATVAQVIVNVEDYGMDPQAANDAPRIFCDKNDDFLYMEARVGEGVVERLERLGHTTFVLGDMDLFFGGVQMTAIWPATGDLIGSADPRRGGSWRSLDPEALPAMR